MTLSKTIYIGICGLVLAGVIHITIILLVPFLGSKDAARQLIDTIPEGRFTRIDSRQDIKIAYADPFFIRSACKFDLDEFAVLVSGPRQQTFWSAAVYNANGEVIGIIVTRGDDSVDGAGSLRAISISHVHGEGKDIYGCIF